MRDNLARSEQLIFHHEAGYVNNPKDPGGPTNHGVTIKTLSAARGRAQSIDDVKKLTKSEAGAILRDMYFKPVRFDDLPSGLDHAVVDFGVNSGPGRATKELQKLLGLATDSVMGPKTIAAARAVNDVDDLIERYCIARLQFCKGLTTFKTFGRGWTRRITGIDPLGQMKPQLGVVGEAKAMRAGKTPLGIDPAPKEFAPSAKAREVDRKATATAEGKGGIITVAASCSTGAAAIAEQLTPYGETFKIVGYVVLACAIVGAIATAVILINKTREAGADA